MFTRSIFFLSSLAVLSGKLLAAEPAATRQLWISPMAAKVIERSRAAYTGMQGWTATLEWRQRLIKNGVEQQGPHIIGQMRRTERFWNDGSATGSYAFSFSIQHESRPRSVLVQNAGEQFGLARDREGKLIGTVELPTSYPCGWTGPDARLALEAALMDATYVGYFGQEQIDGRSFDVIQ